MKRTKNPVVRATTCSIALLRAFALAFLLLLLPIAAIGQGPQRDFYIIFCSDAQYPWVDVDIPKDQNGNTIDSEYNARSEKLNLDHVKSMQALAQQLGVHNIKGVIMNGDLTAYGHGWQLDKYKEMWDKGLGLKIYAGLGNHDYANNVDASFENHAPSRMIEYMHDHVQRLPVASYDFVEKPGAWEYEGSMAYSWDIGDIHFVQLQNYPAYEANIKGYDAGRAGTETFTIKNSMEWLRNDLALARNAGKAIIVNMHDCGGEQDPELQNHFSKEHPTEWQRFLDMLKEFSVSAVFSGHFHSYCGKQRNLLNDVYHFRCGGTSYSTYLLARFEGNKMIVEHVSSKDGIPKRGYVIDYLSDTNTTTVTLKRDVPATPFNAVAAVPPWKNAKGYLFTTKGNYYRFGTYKDVTRLDVGHYPHSTNSEWSTGGKAVKGAVVWPNGYVYLFLDGGYFHSMSQKTGQMNPGSPLEITDSSWPGLGAYKNQICGGLNWGNGKVYIFLNDGRYVRYDVNANRVDAGFPAPIKGNWGPLLGDKLISSVCNWKNSKALFFTTDGWFYQYDIKSEKVDPGYPIPLTEYNFPGLGDNPGAITAGFWLDAQ